jgi:Fe-Mn family superoxide dismutase
MENKNKFYMLPELPYAYNALAPYMSEEQLRLHHDKHHAAYVNASNALFESLDKARLAGAEIDAGTIAKQLSYNNGGHRLHTMFWKNLSKPKEGNKPAGNIAKALDEEFGSFERFKKEFTQVAVKTEGSGWAVLSYCPETTRLIIMQIEKHNGNVSPKRPIILVLDVWEHAYYIDYKNDRAKYVENYWNLVNWDEVDKRLAGAVVDPLTI